MRKSRLVGRVLQSYWRLTRSLTMGAQGAVVRDDGMILLVRHAYRPGWHFPGGGVEKNETAMTALRRELHEEAGIEITAPPRLLGVYANFRNFPSDHVALYVIDKWRQPAIPEPNREIAEIGFFAQTSLPDGTTPAVRRRLAEIAGALTPDENW